MTFYDDMPDNAKVWIYQSSRAFRDVEVQGIRIRLKQFIENWSAHGSDLKAFGDVYFNQFIVLFVDEASAKASGCSIDSSVHFIKELETVFEVDLFDRLALAYLEQDEVKLLAGSEVKDNIINGRIDENTIVFNNLVQSKAAFENDWKIPLKDSWAKEQLV